MSYPKVVKTKEFTISASTAYSEQYWLPMAVPFSLHVVYTSGAGQAILQYSNNGENWVDVSGSEQNLSGSSSAFFDISSTGANSVRIKFTGSSGCSGTIYSSGGVK